jgi:hypothetical protein
VKDGCHIATILKPMAKLRVTLATT